MNKNIDQYFKEKFDDLEIRPKPVSKDIFLKRAAQKNVWNIYLKYVISVAAAVLILAGTYLLWINRGDTTNSVTIMTEEHTRITDIKSVHNDEDKMNEEKQIEDIQLIKKESTQMHTIAVHHEKNAAKEQPVITMPDAVIQPIEELVNQSAHNISEDKEEIDIRISGLSQQIIYYASAESYQKPTEIAFQIVNRKITFQSQMIDEAEHTYHQIKKGIKDLNIADAGRYISNQLSERIPLKSSK